MRNSGPVAATALLAVGFGILVGTHWVNVATLVMLLLFVSGVYLLGSSTRTKEDSWLPGLMVLALLAKLAGSAARYWVGRGVYGGGDAGRYHTYALEIADIWRSLQIPDVATVGFGGEGTRFTTWVTGLVYAPYEPELFGGFWIFALLAFMGQFLLYLAFRRSTESTAWKRYAVLVFFWPTLIYWPSSIGKEALILLFLGLASWAAAHLYQGYRLRWLPVIAGSLVVIGMVRIHLAAIIAAGLMVALALEKRRPGSMRHPVGRLAILITGAALMVPLLLGVSDQFGVALDASVSADVLDPAFSSVGDQTQTGGSAVAGGVIRSPADIPAGVLKVLFRPFPFDAGNLQMLAASLEGVILMGLIAWRFPAMTRNWRWLRQTPYLIYCLAYSALFVWAWSAILNLGILARQRALVVPLVLAVVAALGWESVTNPSRHEVTQDGAEFGAGTSRSTG